MNTRRAIGMTPLLADGTPMRGMGFGIWKVNAQRDGLTEFDYLTWVDASRTAESREVGADGQG